MLKDLSGQVYKLAVERPASRPAEDGIASDEGVLLQEGDSPERGCSNLLSGKRPGPCWVLPILKPVWKLAIARTAKTPDGVISSPYKILFDCAKQSSLIALGL